ncbi:MAG: hypothetical protein M3R04_08000, partial [bacterium]|nr:hypothetical protein [bacterium]
MGFLEKLFDSNEKDIKRLRKDVVAINDFEPRVKQLSDEQMRQRIAALRQDIRGQIDTLGYLTNDAERDVINPRVE